MQIYQSITLSHAVLTKPMNANWLNFLTYFSEQVPSTLTKGFDFVAAVAE